MRALLAAALAGLPGAAAAGNVTRPPQLLFASLDAAHDVTGLLAPRGGTIAAAPGDIGAPSAEGIAIYAAILPNATFEVFMVEPDGARSDGPPRVRVARYLSDDLKAYTAAAVVLSGDWVGASVARDAATGRYLMLGFGPPGGALNRTVAVAFGSADGRAFAPVHADARPAYATRGGPSASLLYPRARLVRYPRLCSEVSQETRWSEIFWPCSTATAD